jgi:hypothetical protein
MKTLVKMFIFVALIFSASSVYAQAGADTTLKVVLKLAPIDTNAVIAAKFASLATERTREVFSTEKEANGTPSWSIIIIEKLDFSGKIIATEYKLGRGWKATATIAKDGSSVEGKVDGKTITATIEYLQTSGRFVMTENK